LELREQGGGKGLKRGKGFFGPPPIEKKKKEETAFQDNVLTGLLVKK